MKELSVVECGEVFGGGLKEWAAAGIALYDAVKDGVSGFIDGAMAGYGYEEEAK